MSNDRVCEYAERCYPRPVAFRVTRDRRGSARTVNVCAIHLARAVRDLDAGQRGVIVTEVSR